MRTRKRKICMIVSMFLAIGILFQVDSQTAMAATRASWNISYVIGAPNASPTNYLYVTYTANGYKATCTKLDGSIDRMVKISSSDAGGMTTKTITVTGTTALWKMNGSKNGDVKFKVSGSASVNCFSAGLIWQYN